MFDLSAASVSVPKDKLAWSLFALRLTVVVVLVPWVVMKFIAPAGAAGVFAGFYGLSDLGATVVYVLGAVQAAIVLAFAVGFQKRLATGLVFVMHGLSTLVSYNQYLDPFTTPNLLFYAAWPMLAAIGALYVLRAYDTKLSLNAG